MDKKTTVNEKVSFKGLGLSDDERASLARLPATPQAGLYLLATMIKRGDIPFFRPVRGLNSAAMGIPLHLVYGRTWSEAIASAEKDLNSRLKFGGEPDLMARKDSALREAWDAGKWLASNTLDGHAANTALSLVDRLVKRSVSNARLGSVKTEAVNSLLLDAHLYATYVITQGLYSNRRWSLNSQYVTARWAVRAVGLIPLYDLGKDELFAVRTGDREKEEMLDRYHRMERLDRQVGRTVCDFERP